MKQLVILAGGMGTRLRARLGDLPKPMIPITGKPLLEHQILLAKNHGFRDIIILACYRADLIEKHFGNGAAWGVSVRTIVEKEPLGTAGALLAVFDLLDDDFVVMYGDTMVNVDLERLARVHTESRADATLLVHPNDHPLDSDLVEASAEGWITAFHNRPHPADRLFQNLVSAGLYCVRKAALGPWKDSRDALDFGKDLFPAMLRKGAKLLAYNSPEYIKDIGTPERYDKINAEAASGVVQRSSLNSPQRAVFLDRDGTLIKEVDGLASPEQVELLPGVGEAIHELNHHGWRAVLVTNQLVVAKSSSRQMDVQAIHNKLEMLLATHHAFLDRIYTGPHHSEKGLLQAHSDLNLDFSRCWLIGDSATALQTGKNAGLNTILVRAGQGGHDGKSGAAQQITANNLLDAVRLILARTES